MQKSVVPDGMQFLQPPGTGALKFSAIRPENLGATEYTLVTMLVDTTGSVAGFVSDLFKMILAIIDACNKPDNPRRENLLLRFVTFDTFHGIVEVHGFKPLDLIDKKDYKPPDCDGMTPLFDATFDAINATLHYSQTLRSQYFTTNGAIYIITDGANNASTIATERSIKKRLEDSKKKEIIESLITVLIGINVADCKDLLLAFKEDAGLTQFVEVGNATAQRLAKLVEFVSKSVSSTAQAVGTGAPSQPVTF